jgi:two-component system, chemotaxis family, protein-glutamate methylesterase/glutaminase
MITHADNPNLDEFRGRFKLIVAGASAGAIEALSVILPALPPGFGLPVAAVVHCPPDRESAIVDIFRSKCQVHVKEAEDKEPLEPGTIYFAPPNYHLLVERTGRLSLSSDEPVLFSRPSIDVLFESAADAFGQGVLGIVLTGANNDGAKGLEAICAAGGRGVVQAPAQAYSSTMPSAALRGCPGALALSLHDISKLLEDLHQLQYQIQARKHG